MSYLDILTANNTKLQELITKANNLPDAIVLPTVTNAASPEDLLLGAEAIDADGNLIVGTFTLDEEISDQSELLSQIETELDNK